MPLRVMQIIEVGVLAFRRHWRPLVAGTAVLAIVPLLLSDLAQVRLGDAVSAGVTFDPRGLPQSIGPDQLNDILAAGALVILAELIASALLTLASLLASVYVARDYRGLPTTLGTAFERVARRGLVALGVWLLSTLATVGIVAGAGLLAAGAVTVLPPPEGGIGGLGAFLALVILVGGVVGFALVSVRLLVAPVAAVLEDHGPIHALRRSWHLTGGNAWRSFGLVLIVSLTVSVLVAIAAQFIALIVDSLGVTASVQVGAGVVFGLLLGLLTAPILPVMETVLYFDLCVRRDGLTLNLPAPGPTESPSG